jgi:uncharacterized protein (DUF1684 family)
MKGKAVLLLTTLLVVGCSTSRHAADMALQSFRAEHIHELVTDERGPLTEQDIDFLSFYSNDRKFNVIANFVKNDDPKPFMISTYSGKEKSFIKYGTLTMTVNKERIELALYQNVKLSHIEAYQEYLFLPFKDLTNGDETYGGGRYIDITMSEIVNDEVRVDFNKCYNPWCAYSDGYNCPIPPLENHLNIFVRAGEKNYLGEKKKR